MVRGRARIGGGRVRGIVRGRVRGIVRGRVRGRAW